ncbi:MAG: PQQ-dependent sugar dehydrogenase [Actinobacteria bacterium]|nr:PQQ-dependent sugar dehydrogenase [Actinomycetota bacterium]
MQVTGRSLATVAAAILLGLGLVACDPGGEPRVTGTVGRETSGPASPPAVPTASPTPPPGTAEPADDADPSSVGLTFEEVASGFESPLHVLPAPAGGLLVVEQPGRIQLLRDGEASVYLDIVDRVIAGGERGLLGVAFAPEDRDRVFVHYSGAGGRTTLSTFAVDGDAADPASEEVLLTVDQPAANHNGGQILFGPDGHLYLGLGDGGGANDRFDNGQDPHTLLGTILRLDVASTAGAYDIPPDNPFADGREGAPEVWAYGLRNPYRLDFGVGRLFITDVGQNAVEEIDAEPAGAAGLNYGWPILEGPDCFAQPDCEPAGTTLPVTSYRHEDTGGCAAIGGEVYEGRAIPALVGWYLYSDLCAGFLRAVRVADDGSVEEVELTDRTGEVPRVLGFGHDESGELLVTLADGRVLRLVPA